MQPVHSTPTFTAYSSPGTDQKLLSELKLDCVRLQKTLQYHHLEDATTQLISKWHDTFQRALDNTTDADPPVRQFVPLLHRILHDPVPTLLFPLDDQTYLTSDGHAVGHKALCLYLHAQPQERRGTSPFSLKDLAPFTVRPHPVARAYIAWLERRGFPLPSHPLLEATYKALHDAKTLPTIPLPTALATRVEQLRAQQKARAPLPKITHEDPLKKIEEALKEGLQKSRTRREETEAEQKKLHALVDAEIRAFAHEAEALKRQHEKLSGELEALRGPLARAQEETIALQRSINEVQQAIVERQQASSDGLFSALISVAACISLTAILPPTASATPLQGGGALFRGTVPIAL